MPAGHVQVAPDSTGKDVDADSLVSTEAGTPTVYRQIVGVGDPGLYTAKQSIFPASFARVSDEPRQIFYDPFDGAVVDQTNRWTSSTPTFGAVAAAQNGGVLTLGTGTTANGATTLASQPSFAPPVPGWLGVSSVIKVESPVLVNSYRFWGQGSLPGGAPTATAPLTEAVGFELYTDGKLYAVVYAGGVRTVIQDLSVATGNAKQPTDALMHRYIVYIRTDVAYWYIDGLGGANLAATSSFQSPTTQTLPTRFLAIAGATPPASSAVLTCSGTAVWDTAKNATQIADGTYPWRKAKIDASGNRYVAGIVPGNQRSRFSANADFVAATGADTLVSFNVLRVLNLTAGVTSIVVSSGKQLRITNMMVSATATTANAILTVRFALLVAGVAVTVTSTPVFTQHVSINIVTGNAGSGVAVIPIPSGTEFSGTDQIGVLYNATAVCALDVNLLGYEYTP